MLYCFVRGIAFCGVIIFLIGYVFSGKASAVEKESVMVSNISSDRFTVSWANAARQTGMLKYGTTPLLGDAVYDDYGKGHEGTMHYITITGLKPDTTYYYDTVSGEKVDDNGARHYTAGTGPSLAPSIGSDIVYGRVFLKDSSMPAGGVIVYIKLVDKDGSGTNGESQLCSSLTDSNGYWYFDLKNMRSETLNSYFSYSETGDALALEVRSSHGVVASFDVNTSEARPVADVIGR